MRKTSIVSLQSSFTASPPINGKYLSINVRRSLIMSLRIDSSSPFRQNVPPPNGAQAPPDSLSVTDAIEDTFDLSRSGRDLLQTLQSLAPADRESYLNNLARLLKAGIVGTETLEVEGRAYQSFATTRLADPRLAHARHYR